MRAKRSARFAIRFSCAEKKALEKLAVEKDLTASQLVRRAIKQLLTQQGEAAQ